MAMEVVEQAEDLIGEPASISELLKVSNSKAFSLTWYRALTW